MSDPATPIRFQDVDLDNDAHLGAFMDHLLDEGFRRVHAEITECIRLGILDDKGNLLLHDLPEDMRGGSEADFGG